MRTASDPEFSDQRLRAIKCRKCDSSDVWRIQSHDNAFSALFHRGLKPFQCRACRYCFYHYARRRSDLLEGENPSLPNPRARVALCVIMVAIVVAFSFAGWRWRRASRNRAARNRISHELIVPDRLQDRPYPNPGNLKAVVTPPVAETMTNEDVVNLKQAGLTDSVIIAKMRSVHCEYKLATSDIVALKRAGFSDDLISAMLQMMKAR
jgi:hypothetical protein